MVKVINSCICEERKCSNFHAVGKANTRFKDVLNICIPDSPLHWRRRRRGPGDLGGGHTGVQLAKAQSLAQSVGFINVNQDQDSHCQGHA